MRAIVLVICFAKFTLQTSPDLSADTNTVSNLDGGDLVANFDGLANNLMTNTDWKWTIAPTASDGMDIGTTNTAAFNLDIDITIFELLGFELRTQSTHVEVKNKSQRLLTSFFSKSVHLL